MTSPDTQPPVRALTRRELRARRRASGAHGSAPENASAPTVTETVPAPVPAAELPITDLDLAPSDAGGDSSPDAAHASAPTARWATKDALPTALAWVRAEAVAASDHLLVDDEAAPALLADVPRRSTARAAVMIPALLAAGLGATYVTSMALWPLHEVAPVVTEVDVTAHTSDPATLMWPEVGTGAVGVEGLGAASSSTEALPIASITKVVSALMVLDRQPIAVGESGPSYTFTRADAQDYWRYRNRDESALDVPVGGSLTQYELLQGTLIGSANNYIDRLSEEIWGSDREFAAAAEIWLSDRGLDNTRIVEPTGIDARNTASPHDLVRLAEIAMANPILREIVGTPAVELPGAGEVVNTNPLLGENGINGLKTGLLRGSWNLLSSKEVVIGDTPLLVTAAVLGQESSEERSAQTRALFAQVEEQLRSQPDTVPAGTPVGEVTTLWGESARIVTDEAARVVLWNGADAAVVTTIALDTSLAEDDQVGTLTVTGPLGQSETSLSLTTPITGPSLWWRLTHPLDLLGLHR